MVVVVLQPGGELVVARLVARGEQALRADIAHQQLTLELRDLGIGLRPVAGRLRLEDAPVAIAGLVVEDGRQIGNDGAFVELDDRRRRHEDRGAGRRGTDDRAGGGPGDGRFGRGLGRLQLSGLLHGLSRGRHRHQGDGADHRGRNDRFHAPP